MARIFGHYNLKNNRSSFLPKMTETFKTENTLIDYINFNNDSLTLIYEALENARSKYLYYIDDTKQLACFITGNINAYEDSTLKVLTQENIVKFILGKYLKSGLEFIKHLRGYFNIIIIDKKQPGE